MARSTSLDQGSDTAPSNFTEAILNEGTRRSAGDAGSLIEGALCQEAYSYMAAVTPGFDEGDWSKVPECAPTALDGQYYESCAACAPATCPMFHHYQTPLYQEYAPAPLQSPRVHMHADMLRLQSPAHARMQS